MSGCTGLSLSQHLDLFPSLGNLEEETSRCCDVRQSSLRVPVGVLHHAVTCRKRFQLKNRQKKKKKNIRGKLDMDFTATIFMFLWCVIMVVYYLHVVQQFGQKRVSLTDAELPVGPGGPGGPGGPAMVKAARAKTVNTFRTDS